MTKQPADESLINLESPKTTNDYVVKIYYKLDSLSEAFNKHTTEFEKHRTKAEEVEKIVHSLVSKRTWQQDAMRVVSWLLGIAGAGSAAYVVYLKVVLGV